MGLCKTLSELPEEEVLPPTKVLYFGKVRFQIHKNSEFAETKYGDITRDEIIAAIDYIETAPKLAGYPLSIFSNGDWESFRDISHAKVRNFKIGFGCEEGTLKELIAIRDAFDVIDKPKVSQNSDEGSLELTKVHRFTEEALLKLMHDCYKVGSLHESPSLNPSDFSYWAKSRIHKLSKNK